MGAGEYYRGGNSLVPSRREVKFDPDTGLVLPLRGVSVFNPPDNLDRFGGAHRLTNIPPELRIVQRGRDPSHHEIIPAQPMTWEEYREALGKIVLIPV